MKHDGYYEYYQREPSGQSNDDYVCISDYVMMNPAARETKKGDFRYLRDKAKELGLTVHYFDKQGFWVDQYGVSFLKSEIDTIEIDNGYPI